MRHLLAPFLILCSTWSRARLTPWLGLSLLWTLPVVAYADTPPPPVDVLGSAAADQASPTLSPAPLGFETRSAHGVRWEFPSVAADQVRELMDAHPDLWTRITGELGVEIDPTLRVRVARSPDELRRLAPLGAPPPAYATGVAYPAWGLVLLSLVSPDSWLPPDLPAVYTHELSHIALHRGVKGQPVPRWLSEGLAIYQAKEQRLARVRTLWEATVMKELLPLDRLDRSFPTRPHQVNVAYAQSGDFVQHLLSDSDDRSRFRRVLRDVAAGQPFGHAVEEAYYVPPEFLEREWRASLDARFTTLPLLLTGSAMWVLLALLLVWAFVSKRRRDRKTLAQWADQEAAAEANRPPQVVVLATQPQERLHADAPAWQASGQQVLHHTPAAGVPTVEHDGQQHTLH